MSLIYSHIIYCLPVWGNTWACYLRPVEIAQKRAIRTINFLGRYDHTHDLFVNQKLLKFKYVVMYFDLLLVFKFLNFNYVPQIFSRTNNVYQFRNNMNIMIPFTRSELFKKSVFVSAPSIWYNLVNSLKNIQNINTFKHNLKKHLLEIQKKL